MDEIKLGSDKEMDTAMDLIKKSLADGSVEYLLVGELVAAIPVEQADRWDEIIATSRAARKFLGI
jgi:hypothetical protein